MLVALASVVVLYFVAANVLLRTRLLRNLLNTSPDSLLIDYRSASMWWPGRVHLEGFRLRNHDDHLEWEVRLERADVRIDLWRLVHREFHVTRLRGDGVRFRAVRRLDPEQLERAVVAALPPIEGYARPPRKLARSPETFLRHDPWSVRIEDVDLEHVGEAWVDGQRYTDDGRARGAFMVRPGRRVWVAATFEARAGELHFGEDAMATAVKGLVDFRMDEVDPRSAPGSMMLRHCVVTADLDAHLPDLLWLRGYVPKATVAFVGGGGDGRIELRYARGLLMPGTHVRVFAKDFTAAAENGWSLAGDALMDASIAEPTAATPWPMFTLRIDGTDLALRHRWAEIWPLASPGAALLIRAHRLAILDHPFEDLALSIDVPSATLSSLRALAVLVPPKTDAAFTGGSATLSGHLDASLETGALQGHLDVNAKGAAGRWAKSNLRADVVAHYVLAKGHRGSLAGDLRGSYVHIRNASVTGGDAPKAWWGRVDVLATKAAFGAFRLDLALAIKDARPVFALLDATDTAHLPGWVRDLFALDGLTGSAKLVLSPDRLALTDFVAQAGGFVVLGDLRRHGARTRSVVYASSTLGSLGLVSGPGGTDLTLLPGADWMKKQTLESMTW